MKDFSKEKRNTKVLRDDEKILGTPEKGVSNKDNKEIEELIKKEIKKDSKNGKSKNKR